MYEQIFEFAKQCGQVAAEMAVEFSQRTVKTERKVDKTWVTEADSAIEVELRKRIQSKFPEHHIMGEEFGGSNSFPENEFTWILDPIDGTFSFVHGIPFYSSLIAVMHGNQVVVGFASLPAMDICMSAMKGGGAFINNKPYVRPSRLGNSTIEIVATADPYRFRMENKIEALNFLYAPERKVRTYPDGLGYYLLLNGSVRAFVDPKVEIWDVAPFHCILPEAGFAIESWSGEKMLKKGTSLAYPLNVSRLPLACQDIIDGLRSFA